MKTTIKIEISTRSIIAVFSIMALIWILYVSKEVILFLFASFIIASALLPIVNKLSKKMRRSLAVALIYLVGFIILSTFLVPFFTILINEIQEFLIQFPKYYQSIGNEIIGNHSINYYMSMLHLNKANLAAITNYGENILSSSINVTINIFETIVGAFMLATIVLFILLDSKDLKRGALKFFPPQTREKAENIASIISKRIGGYVSGQLMVMLGVGLVTSAVLAVLKIPFAFLLGMVAGVCEIIPIIGPIVSAIPAILLALAISPWMAIIVIVAYLIIQRIENFISPFVYGKFLELPPLVIIFALLISASTLGFIGVILSPAIAAAIYVLIQELYLKKINSDADANSIK